MAYMQGCTCEDCRQRHQEHWRRLSDRQQLLIATIHVQRSVSARSLYSRGFRQSTVLSLQRGKKLIRTMVVTGGDTYYSLTVRGNEVYDSAPRH